MTPADLHELLRRGGVSQSAIADELGVRAPAVNRWLKGKDTSARIKAAVHKYAAQVLDEEANTMRFAS